MSEELDWGDVEAAPKSKGFPKWLLFCGGGCLLLVIAGIGASVWGYRWFLEARDPDVQWPRIEEIVAADEGVREEYTLGLGMRPTEGFDQFQLVHKKTGLQVVLMRQSGAEGTEARQKLFEGEDVGLPENMPFIDFEGAERTTVSVQGRELKAMRFTTKIPVVGSSASLFLDLGEEGAEGLVMIQITRQGGSQPITDDEVREALGPFHIGPDRPAAEETPGETDEGAEEALDELEEEETGDGGTGDR